MERLAEMAQAAEEGGKPRGASKGARDGRKS